MEPETKTNGASVGLVIIVIILIVGGIYFWQTKTKDALEQKQKIEAAAKILTPADNTDLGNLSNELNDLDTSTGVDVNTLK
jgi:uncharacterized protein HemX